jgi:hypothetical protein
MTAAFVGLSIRPKNVPRASKSKSTAGSGPRLKLFGSGCSTTTFGAPASTPGHSRSNPSPYSRASRTPARRSRSPARSSLYFASNRRVPAACSPATVRPGQPRQRQGLSRIRRTDQFGEPAHSAAYVMCRPSGDRQTAPNGRRACRAPAASVAVCLGPATARAAGRHLPCGCRHPRCRPETSRNNAYAFGLAENAYALAPFEPSDRDRNRRRAARDRCTRRARPASGSLTRAGRRRPGRSACAHR